MESEKERWEGGGVSACVGAVWFVRFTNKEELDGVRVARVLGVGCQVWTRPVCLIIECVCGDYEGILSSKVSTVWCCLFSDLLTPLFSLALWQRPALSFPLCIPLTLAAVSLPRCDKPRLNHTHTCALWRVEVLNQQRFHSHLHKTKTEEESCISLYFLLVCCLIILDLLFVVSFQEEMVRFCFYMYVLLITVIIPSLLASHMTQLNLKALIHWTLWYRSNKASEEPD